jgi:hypothetical protein
LPSCSIASATHNAASLASLSLNAAHVLTLRHHLPTVGKSAESRKTHSAKSLARGFGLPGLSGAYRQPKLFRLSDGRLLGPPARKADILRLADSGRQVLRPIFDVYVPFFRKWRVSCEARSLDLT